MDVEFDPPKQDPSDVYGYAVNSAVDSRTIEKDATLFSLLPEVSKGRTGIRTKGQTYGQSQG